MSGNKTDTTENINDNFFKYTTNGEVDTNAKYKTTGFEAICML